MPDETPVPEIPPKKKKKMQVGYATKMALLEVIAKKNLGYEVGYTAIARKWGISATSLRSRYSQYKDGHISLEAEGDGLPTVAEIKIDLEQLFKDTIDASKRHHKLLVDQYQGQIAQAEEAASKGNSKSLEEFGVPKTLEQLIKVVGFRTTLERGHNSLLEEMISNRQQQLKPPDEKQANAVEIVSTKIVTANDEQRAIEVLSEPHG